MKRVVCENTGGETIEFTYDGYPLGLSDTSGFSAAEYTVQTSQNSGQDGETYNGETANKRNPVITANIFSDYQAQRDRLYSFFQPRSIGTVYYYEDDSEGRKAGYYVEKIDVEESGAVRGATISLICPDPKFYALEDDLTQLAVWQGKITFPLTLPPQINASGQSVTITPDASITDYDKIAITGQTVQAGTGDPSPTNVRAISGVTSLTVSDGGSNSQTITLPQTLYSLPDGTADSYDAVSGSGTEKVGKITWKSANDLWGTWQSASNIISTGMAGFTLKTFSTVASICCNNLKAYQTGSYNTLISSKLEGIIWASDNLFRIVISASRLGTITSDMTTAQVNALFATWLASNPVTVLYALAAPVQITGTVSVPIYHPTTILSLNAGTLSLRCRGKFTVTDKINTLIGNVHNDSAVEMGLTVKFMASGTVVNPSLYDVNRQLLMKINKTMSSGDVIIITTGDNNKRVKLISGGVISNINNLMAYPPKWLKAYQGDNLFRYNADSGIDNLSVSILTTQAYWGA